MLFPGALAITFFLVLTMAPRDPTAEKVQVSKDPLTTEQVAVYRAVLSDYMQGTSSSLNLDSTTELPEWSAHLLSRECAEGFDLESTSVSTVHKIDRRILITSRIVLVDRGRQQKKIQESDPGRMVKKAVDDHERVSDKQLDDSLKQAFNAGLFTFSEIAFDKSHHRAIVSYSFVCGGLCGQGSTMVLRSVGQRWKIMNRCGGWIS